MGVSIRLRPCFRAIDNTLHNVAKSFAPCGERNVPEVFMRSLIMHGSRSSRSFAKDASGSCRKRSVSVLKSRKRNARGPGGAVRIISRYGAGSEGFT